MLGVNGLRSAVGGGIEIDAVDDPLQRRVFLGDGPHVGGHALADLVGELADDRPDRLLGIGRLQRQEDADEIVLRFTHDLRDAFGFMRSAVARGSVIALGELERLFPRPDLGGDAVQLVIEDIAEALGEDEREDEVLVFRRVLRATDGTGGVPDPLFEGLVFLGLGGGGFTGGHQMFGP